MPVRYMPIGTFNLGSIAHEEYRFHGRLDVPSSNVFLFHINDTDSSSPDGTARRSSARTGSNGGSGGGPGYVDVSFERQPPDVLANCADLIKPTIVLYDDELFQRTITDPNWLHRLSATLQKVVGPHLDPQRARVPRTGNPPRPRRMLRP
ncbi:hypothetical protein [Haloglycomyces albus]|uniref:hypothetical protein n=1 Tax=Haloglycomyces albus TaxID=526067 RepID=UPI0012EB733A|nr:hypothetical protein [Haloglycomyces albus]